MSGDDDATTIVYAVNDFPAIARALKQLNGAPTHHGTALATIQPTPPGAMMLRPPTMHELVVEEQMRAAAKEAARQMAYRQAAQQIMQRHLQEIQEYAQGLRPEAAQGLQTEEQQQRAIQHFMQQAQCNMQGHGHYMQASADPGHSHGLQAAAQLGHTHHQ